MGPIMKKTITESSLRAIIRRELKLQLNGKRTKLLTEDGEKAGTLELHTTEVEKAKVYAKKIKIDVDKDIPNFDANYKKAQEMANLGKTKRKDMPVIDDNQVKQFQARLEKGYVDINKPYSKTFNEKNPFPTGLSGFKAKDFLTRGLKDGAKNDDIIDITIKNIPVNKLKPIQKQIYVDKSLDATAKFGIDGTTKFLTSKTFFIASDDNFIIDGHHRYLSAMLIDPNMKVNVLSIDLPIKDLLPLSTAYGDAIGNKRNESVKRLRESIVKLSDGTFKIKDISFGDFKELMTKSKSEGIVLLGVGGDLNEWINGVTDMLNQEDISKGEVKELFRGLYILKTTGSRIDLAMVFNPKGKHDIGKLAMWRLRFGDCSWISDYLVNYEKQHYDS